MKAYVYNGIEFPKGHYFSGKCVLFVGTLERCSRRDASDMLFFDCGGIPVERYAVWVEYVVVGKAAEKLDVYREAKQMEQEGLTVLLTEQEFFDTMDGIFTPLPNPNRKEPSAVVFHPSGIDWEKRETAQHEEFLANKRDDYLRKRKSAGNKYDVRLQDEMSLQFTRKQVDAMWTALGRWGEAAQAYQTIEECAELIVALNKKVTRTPAPDSLENILDEIADVEMMLAQMRITFGISDEMLTERIKKKFDKLEKHLKDDAVRTEGKKRHEDGIL